MAASNTKKSAAKRSPKPAAKPAPKAETPETPEVPETPKAAEPARDVEHAPLLAPEPKKEAPAPVQAEPQTADVAATLLAANRTAKVFLEGSGQPADPTDLFTEPDASGLVISKHRLVETATATAFDRPVTRLLLAAGAVLSAGAAAQIAAQVAELNKD